MLTFQHSVVPDIAPTCAWNLWSKGSEAGGEIEGASTAMAVPSLARSRVSVTTALRSQAYSSMEAFPLLHGLVIRSTGAHHVSLK